MSESAIRTAIYNAVNGVSDVGLVYDYERHANDWGAFLANGVTWIASYADFDNRLGANTDLGKILWDNVNISRLSSDLKFNGLDQNSYFTNSEIDRNWYVYTIAAGDAITFNNIGIT